MQVDLSPPTMSPFLYDYLHNNILLLSCLALSGLRQPCFSPSRSGSELTRALVVAPIIPTTSFTFLPSSVSISELWNVISRHLKNWIALCLRTAEDSPKAPSFRR